MLLLRVVLQRSRVRFSALLTDAFLPPGTCAVILSPLLRHLPSQYPDAVTPAHVSALYTVRINSAGGGAFDWVILRLFKGAVFAAEVIKC
jgi:hypothetical protein